MLSHKLVLSESKNFTSGHSILAPPTIPINHYFRSRNQQNRTRSPILLFHANVFIAQACFKHSNFFKVNESDRSELPHSNQIGWQLHLGTHTAEASGPRITTRNPTTSFLTAATLVYATGAGITAAAGTRLALQLIIDKGFKFFSFQLATVEPSHIVIYCHYLLVLRLGNLRACCLPWMW